MPALTARSPDHMVRLGDGRMLWRSWNAVNTLQKMWRKRCHSRLRLVLWLEPVAVELGGADEPFNGVVVEAEGFAVRTVAGGAGLDLDQEGIAGA